MALRDKSSFGSSGITAPNLNGAVVAMRGIGNLISDEQRQLATAKQNAIQNKLANDRLAIAQAAEQRAADTYNAKLADDAAVNAALQNNVYNPEVVDRIGAVYDKIDKRYGPDVWNADGTLANKEKQAAYDKANAMLMPNDQLAEEVATPLSGTAYQQRVLNDLGNVSPAARAQALSLAQAQYPAGDNKEYLKARADVIKNTQTASNQNINGNSLTTKTGAGVGGTGNGTSSQKIDSMKNLYDYIDKNIGKFTTHTAISGEDSGYSLKDKIDRWHNKGGYSLQQLADGVSRFRNGDPDYLDTTTVDVDGMDKWLKANKASYDKQVGTGKGTGGTQVTSKTNPGAQNIINRNAQVALANIDNLFGKGGKKATPKDVVDKLFKGLFDKETKTDITKRANGIKNRPVKQPYGSATLQAAMATPKDSADVAKLSINNPEGFAVAYEAATPAEQNSIDKALTSKASTNYFNNIKQTPLGKNGNKGSEDSKEKQIQPTDTQSPIVAPPRTIPIEMNAIIDDPSSTPAEVAAAYAALGIDATTGAALELGGNVLHNGGTFINNAATGFTNLFRPLNDQMPVKEYGWKTIQDYRNINANLDNKQAIKAATLRKQAAAGKAKALKALQKQYPKASKAQLQLMLDNVKLNDLQTNSGYTTLSNLR